MIYNIDMNIERKRVSVSLPPSTHNKVVSLAEHLECLSEKEIPKPTEAVAKSIRFILGFFDNDEFKKCLEIESGIDTLTYMRKCVNNGMKESLSEYEQQNKGRKK